MKIADSNCHLHFEECKGIFDDILKRAFSVGVEQVLLVGIDPEDSKRALEIAEKHTQIFSSIGIHPQLADKYSIEDLFSLSDLLNDKVVEVGETGYDLYRRPDSMILQEKMFKAHIDFAHKYSLPLIIHDRDAHDHTVRILDDNDAWSIGGVLHCFSGDMNMDSYVLSKGFYISISGVITYKNSDELKKIASMVPLDLMLIETDAPYLSPIPFRGRINEPAYLIYILKMLSEIKKISVEKIAEITSMNFKNLFLSRKKAHGGK